MSTKLCSFKAKRSILLPYGHRSRSTQEHWLSCGSETSSAPSSNDTSLKTIGAASPSPVAASRSIVSGALPRFTSVFHALSVSNRCYFACYKTARWACYARCRTLPSTSTSRHPGNRRSVRFSARLMMRSRISVWH